MRGEERLVEHSGVSAPREGPLSVYLRYEIMVGVRRMRRSGVTSLPLPCPMAGVTSSKEAGEARTGEPLTVRARHAGCAHGDPWSPARPSHAGTGGVPGWSAPPRAVNRPRGEALGLQALWDVTYEVTAWGMRWTALPCLRAWDEC